MKLIKYGKTKKFRDVMKEVTCNTRFRGLTEDGEPIYEDCELPTINFIGTVKLHGQNTAVCYDSETEEVWCQTRNNIIQLNSGHEFSDFIRKRLDKIKSCFRQLKGETEKYFASRFTGIICLYGEWAGQGIQKGCGIHQFEKMWYPFQIRLCSGDNSYRYLPYGLHYCLVDNDILPITLFKTYKVRIDFNNSEDGLEKAKQLVEEVEKECPVAKHLGASGIGEGIVFSANMGEHSYQFKVKGEAHEVAGKGKRGVKISVDPEIMSTIKDFVEYVVTDNRIEQGCSELNIDKGDMPNFGKLIKWIHKDILDEEGDVLDASNLNWKQVVKYVNSELRGKFQE